MATTLTPFLNFNKQCAEAFHFYHQVLGGELTAQTFGASPMKDHVPPEVALGLSDPGDADRIYAALAVVSEVTVPLQEAFGAKRFGMVTDRYGIPWMVNCG